MTIEEIRTRNKQQLEAMREFTVASQHLCLAVAKMAEALGKTIIRFRAILKRTPLGLAARRIVAADHPVEVRNWLLSELWAKRWPPARWQEVIRNEKP